MNRVPRAGVYGGLGRARGGERAQGVACEKRSNLVYPISIYNNMGVSDKPFTTPPILFPYLIHTISSKARGPRHRIRPQSAIPAAAAVHSHIHHPAAADGDGANPCRVPASRF